jgi:uncharacterized protein
MMGSAQASGSVVALQRYPVKSMMGEELNAVEVNEVGLLCDRAYAIVDSSDGKVASAKNPRKWPDLFHFRAEFVDSPQPGSTAPPVRITLPDGTLVTSDQVDISQILSRVLSRTVTFDVVNRSRREGATISRLNGLIAKAEEYWPDIEGLDHRDTVTDFALPEGTFFDTAVVHVLTTDARPATGRVSTRALRDNSDSDPISLCRQRSARRISWRMLGSAKSLQSGIPFA